MLCKKGVKVTVTDELNKSDLKESLDALENYEFDSELGKHVLKTFCEQDFIVVSPGVRLDIKPLEQARKMNLPVISEVELAAQFITEPIIAVTGTNGKTTTATLISEMIQTGGKTAFLGGNVGIPLSEYAIRRDKCDFVVAEISSFQLDSCFEFKPHIAVFLNVAPDHLDRYPSFDDYMKSKLKLKNNLTEDDHVIMNMRDPKLMANLSGIRPKIMHFTTDSLSKIPAHFAEKFQRATLEAGTMTLKSARW